MRLAAIYTYPVKGCRRIDHRAAVVEPWGLAGDRRWLIIGPNGKGLTQREERRLALIRPSLTAHGLVLRTDGAADLDVPVPVGEPVPVTGPSRRSHRRRRRPDRRRLGVEVARP